MEMILQKFSVPGVAKVPCPRFEDWTTDGKSLEFTLVTVIPPVLANIVFGPFNFERETVQMVRCLTADLLDDKYGVQVEPLLVTAQHVEAFVDPSHLLSSLEGLRTSTTMELILCFHNFDWHRESQFCLVVVVDYYILCQLPANSIFG